MTQIGTLIVEKSSFNQRIVIASFEVIVQA